MTWLLRGATSCVFRTEFFIFSRVIDPVRSGTSSPVLSDTFTVAAVQAAPVFLDRDRTIDKACELLEAGRHGAKLAVFPEAFVPGYPVWSWLVPAGRTILYASVRRDQLIGARWQLDVRDSRYSIVVSRRS